MIGRQRKHMHNKRYRKCAIWEIHVNIIWKHIVGHLRPCVMLFRSCRNHHRTWGNICDYCINVRQNSDLIFQFAMWKRKAGLQTRNKCATCAGGTRFGVNQTADRQNQGDYDRSHADQQRNVETQRLPCQIDET